MIDVSIRLRRAVVLNDLSLVRRIIGNHPKTLRNPDFDDRSNTSLHLATKLGFVEIAEFLIRSGHEDEGISLNSEWETPLMFACEAKQVEVGELLIRAFPRCVPWTNKQGMDALMLASRDGTLPLLPFLLTSVPPASTTAHDKDGNTALHYASASGELKALRLLLQFGASPLAQNSYSWTPIAYSATAAAEAYFKQLVGEVERRRVEALKMEREKEKQRMAGVRLVTSGEDVFGSGRAASAASFRPREEGLGALPPVPLDWSPIGPSERKAMTPTEVKAGWNFGVTGRGRAASGD